MLGMQPDQFSAAAILASDRLFVLSQGEKEAEEGDAVQIVSSSSAVAGFWPGAGASLW
jgi:hypothetical protein